jgi:predicted transcriptional regulator
MQFSKREERAPALGVLEIAVLRYVWAQGSADGVDARGVLASLTDRGISLSTVQATLERLHRKGLLLRTKVGRAYRYASAVSQSRLIGSLIRRLTQELAAGELEPVIAGFVELVGDASPELLDKLESEAALLRRKDRG